MNNEIIAKVRDAVSATTKKVVKLSGEALDYTKIRIKISDINSRLDEKYAAIGLAVYEGSEEAQIETICDEIAALRTELAELKLKLDEFKNKKCCSVCSKSTDKDNTFCPHCGAEF